MEITGSVFFHLNEASTTYAYFKGNAKRGTFWNWLLKHTNKLPCLAQLATAGINL